MRSRQSSPSPRAFARGDRIGPRGNSAFRPRPTSSQDLPRADLSQLNDALVGVANATIARALASPEIRAAIFDEIRIIVREEIARAPFADRLMDAAEAAERIGMTEAALRKAAARGTIPCQHKGRRLRFRLSELMVEVEARRGRRDSADTIVPPTFSSTQP
jgi:hypothetical protein